MFSAEQNNTGTFRVSNWEPLIMAILQFTQDSLDMNGRHQRKNRHHRIYSCVKHISCICGLMQAK